MDLVVGAGTIHASVCKTYVFCLMVIHEELSQLDIPVLSHSHNPHTPTSAHVATPLVSGTYLRGLGRGGHGN